MKHEISVEQKHIDQGIVNFKSRKVLYRSKTCPLALSINESLNTTDASISDAMCFVNDREYVVPPSAASFIRDFDIGIVGKPFKFILEEKK